MAAGLRLPTWLGDRFETWHSQLDLLWGRLLYVVVGHLSRLWSRDDRLWLFGARGGEGFVDTKYQYLWTLENDPGRFVHRLSTNRRVWP